MNDKIERIASNLEAAKSEFLQGLDSLRTPNETPVYSSEEESRRRRELEATYRVAQQSAEAALQEARAVAQQDIDGDIATDPLTRLQSGDMDKALQLQPFISEDFQRLPERTLAAQAREALQSGDKVRIALHVRYARQTLQTRFSAPGEGHELRQALEELEETYVDRAKRQSAEETLRAAGKLTTSMATERYLSQAYGTAAIRQRTAP